MGLLCCKYNNQQSKQKIVPTFRKHQHISFSILQLELSQYNTIRRKYRQRKKKQARLRQLEKENRNKIVKETESKENESDIPSDGLEQTKNASHLYREKIYVKTEIVGCGTRIRVPDQLPQTSFNFIKSTDRRASTCLPRYPRISLGFVIVILIVIAYRTTRYPGS